MVSESVAQGASLPRGVGACIHTLPESVVSLIPWRPRCSEEAAVPLSGQTAVKEALFQRGEVCCSRQQTGDFCADPFLRFRRCGSCRQARSLDPATLRLARQRGRKTVENFDSNGCVHRARAAGRGGRAGAGAWRRSPTRPGFGYFRTKKPLKLWVSVRVTALPPTLALQVVLSFQAVPALNVAAGSAAKRTTPFPAASMARANRPEPNRCPRPSG